MSPTQLNITCIWGGTLTGILLKNDVVTTGSPSQKTTKIIGIHGWLDNLNSLLPVAEKLINHHPNYEIYLYDRAGHGFSSHIPKGFDYSIAHNLQDLRTVIQSLRWDKEKFSIIGHSYGAILGMTYAANYPEEVLCLICLDSLPRTETLMEDYFKIQASRIDASLRYHKRPPRSHDPHLTSETVLELTKITRPGITDEAAKLLIERSIRRNADGKIHFTRDESLNVFSLVPISDDIARCILQTTKAPVLFIGATKPQWPRNEKLFDFIKEHNPNFEKVLINGPHHLHMTHVDEVVNHIEQYFNKHLQ
ncbi:unnamed protein product [Rotaria sp. Silwood1]|nr:unnamed protein product [Rotaria sp. Silwood1]CAF1193551.1 unnamed protein product [Rotaria sp. Silwood1]CAF4564330.1 unnamed protein product [Rotaria sp. Silwood1]CAF4588998.1 unnamed protein product [Rotaria sp. Silwood1]